MGERVLNLPVKKIYFDQIKSGEKVYEFRERTPYWTKRIEGREFDFVVITLGYPKRDDMSRRLRLPWRGYQCLTIDHEHFGGKVDVFAIRVGPNPTDKPEERE